MAKLSLQFHADRNEVVSWVAAWAHEMNLVFALESFGSTYHAELVDNGRAGENFRVPCEVCRLSLSTHAIDTGSTSALDFLRRNPDVLVVSLGGQADDWLRESTIAAMTDDAPSLAMWKAIRNKAKALMCSGGVTVVNPASGTRHSLKSHYYSRGAQDLARLGVRMLASAGWNEYEFDD